MKVLVTGGNGQLAKQIKALLEKGYCDIDRIDKIFQESDFKFLDYDELDITDNIKVEEFFYCFKPELVINCAAYTNVDLCEENIDLAFKINSIGAKNIAIECQKNNSKLIHISTDYVFNGQANLPYREYDIPNPVSIYGKTKYLGEQYVKEFCSKYYIIRTSWLYGEYGKNFVYTIIKLAKEKKYLEVVNDQIGNPTYAEDLVYHILKLALNEDYGIYHCTGNGECSWYDFAKKIIEIAKIDVEIKPITSDKIDRPAKRPSYSSLDNMMLRCTIGDKMRYWEDALKSFINKIEI